ncbi:MAG: DNA-3-methyladenine glycosylase I [Planctomycetales bacterium]|nr:DNA-3-methyladenine glycosylase I [Planctomycetales bacterium]
MNQSTNKSPAIDARQRCPWVDLTKPDYVAYHDEEWGVPVRDDRTMFEFLTLESAQAGLSWYTVLKKRENYRKAFAEFDPAKVAKFSAAKLEKLLANPGLIRNRLKLTAAINNAQRFLEVQKEFGSFTDYIWGFVDNQPVVNSPRVIKDYPTRSAQSDTLSKDLIKRGFKFVGTTIIYAHMQATGMVNDHAADCFRRAEV